MTRCFLLLLLFPCIAHATDLWLTSGFLSHHLTHDSAYYKSVGSYEENNVGIGIEYGNFAAGIYRNSIRGESRYVAYRWSPWRSGEWSAGIVLGAVDGYVIRNGGFVPLVAPAISWEGKRLGANMLLLPKQREEMDAVVAVQFKVKF